MIDPNRRHDLAADADGVFRGLIKPTIHGWVADIRLAVMASRQNAK
jgi:hypothetical protein